MKLWLCRAGLLTCFIFLLSAGALHGASNPGHHGQNLLNFKRYKEAERVFEKALEKDPKNVKFHYNLGLAHFYQEEYRRALRHLSRAIKLNPGSHEAYTARGMVWFHTGNWAKAMDDYTKAIDSNSRYAPAYNQLAWLQAVCPEDRYRNGAKSIDLASKAFEMDPILPYQDTLAAAYAESGQFGKAVGLQKQVIRSLIEQEKTEKLDQYVIRLKRYEAGQPWRFEVAGSQTIADTRKEEQPPLLTVVDKSVPLQTESQTAVESDVTGTEAYTAVKDGAVTKKVSLKYLTRKKDHNQYPQKALPADISQVTAKPKAPPPTSRPVMAFGDVADLFRTIADPQGTHYPYTIQISSYPDATKAYRVAQGLRDRGDAAFTSPAHIPGKGTWYRIFIGYYEDRAEAHRARILNERRFRKTDVLLKPYALQVGLAHSENQLKQYLADLAKGGHMAYWAPDQNTVGKLRVLSGAYATADEAEKYIAPLRALGFRPIVVTR